MHHAMAHSVNLMQVTDDSQFALSEHLENELHAGSVFRHWGVKLHFLALGLNLYERIGQTYLLNAATGDDALVVHVVQSIFDGRRTTV